MTLANDWIIDKNDHLGHINNRNYYNSEQDAYSLKKYYCSIDFSPEKLQEWLVHTHTNQLKYAPHRHVYPWVDLQENLQLKSLYSGQKLDPLQMIEEDLILWKKSEEEGKTVTYNTEHVIPQSWFEAREPMKGDLHHLFACEPACNSMRNNFPYYDFETYQPEVRLNIIRTGCGMSEDGRFEPEYGKGVVARAVFYFSLRYREIINLKEWMDFKILLGWHSTDPVTIYEKHRNASIQELQGNRNPFIDFPDLAEKILGV